MRNYPRRDGNESYENKRDDVERPLTRFMSFTPVFIGSNIIMTTFAGGCGGGMRKHRIVGCDNTLLRWSVNVGEQRYEIKTREVSQLKPEARGSRKRHGRNGDSPA
jgi:hypothetical protein